MDTAQQHLGATSMQLVRRRLLSGSAWTFGGKVLMAFTGLVSNALLARLLSPQDLGAYFLAYSIVMLGGRFGSLGLEATTVRLVAENLGLNRFGRVRLVIGVGLGVGTLGALGVGLVYLLYGDALAGNIFHAPALAAVSGLVAGWMIVAILQGLLAETFRGFHDIRLATILGGQVTGTATGVATIALLAISLGLLWVIEGQATLAMVILLAICSGATSTLVAAWLLRRRVASLPTQPSNGDEKADLRGVFGDVLAISWPLLVAGLVMFAGRQGDIWVVGAFRSQEEVAVYGAALRLVSMVTMPLIIVSAVVPPLIAEMYTRGQREDLEHALRGVATLTGIPALVASVGSICFAGPILGLVYGDYYRQGAMVMALLSTALLITVVTGSCGLTLIYTGHQKTLMMITVVGTAVTVLAMIAAVGPYGTTGVAMSSLVGNVLQSGVTLLMVKKKTGMWTHIGFRALSNLLKDMR